MKRSSGICMAAAIAVVGSAAAQDVYAGDSCTLDLRQLSVWDEDDGRYADIWAEGNVVYQGQRGDNKVHFFDISDPSNPVHIFEWEVTSPNESASAQDVKVANGLLFIALESDGNDGAEIVDVRDPFHPVHLTWVRTPGYSDVHNLFYDNGYLYLADSSAGPQVGIIDLTAYDPDNPPPLIAEHFWLLTDVGQDRVHDMTVQNGRLYACAWDGGLWVYDVANIAAEPPVLLGWAPGNNTHSVWATPDGRWAVACEERVNGPTKLYEIIPNGTGVDVLLRDTFALPSSQAFSAHNPLVVGMRAYVSWYQAGLIVLDIDESTASLEEVATFDTVPGTSISVGGAWGVYPFLGEDQILVSDRLTGLHVLRLTEALLSISYPEGLVEAVDPREGATLLIEISPGCEVPNLDSAKLVVQIKPGGELELPLVSVAGGLLEAELPGTPCGSVVKYYVTVDTLSGATVFDPPGAPENHYVAEVLTDVVGVFDDDFEFDQGWTVGAPDDDATTGIWASVDPIGTPAQPGDDHTPLPGTICFVTGQGSLGGSSGQNDVDGGKTTLISPPLNVSHVDTTIAYWRWFSNDAGSNPNQDPFVVEISIDGGTSWTSVETVDPSGQEASGGWFYHEFRVGDFVSPNGEVMVRFVAVDEGGGSIVEAAIDDFSVVTNICETFGACCDNSLDPVGDTCTDDVLPGDCVGEKLTWYKDMQCDEVFCVAPETTVPTVSQWGMVIMALLLLTATKIYFGFAPRGCRLLDGTHLLLSVSRTQEISSPLPKRSPNWAGPLPPRR